MENHWTRTNKRFALINFMLRYQRQTGRLATVRQIAAAVGLESHGSVCGYYLQPLSRRRYVRPVRGPHSTYEAIEPYVEMLRYADD